MMNLNATKKGLVTGAGMILFSFVIYAYKGGFDNSLQYITYSMYVAGIIWTLMSFKRHPDNPGTFGGYFFQGFRCFIVVVLLMVMFTAWFLWAHPEMTQQMGEHYRSVLLKQGNKTGREIEEQVAIAKKNFLPTMIMAAIFSYLAIGALITAVTAGVLLQQRQYEGRQ
jgi:hypothetical protein